MTRLTWPFFFLACVALSSCDQDRTATAGRTGVSVSAQLLEKVTKLEGEIASLQYRISSLESDDATVSTEKEVYGVARTNFGPFVMVSRGVTPHLDGYKITLSIGNLTSATFHGAKLKVGWGPRPTDGTVDLTNYKDREFDVTTVFYPGAYSLVEISLTPAKADEVRRISVGMHLNQVALRK